MYITPDQNRIRLHHVRPRFKSNVEEVMIFMAEKISSLEEMPKSDFNEKLLDYVSSFPGNQAHKEKTLNNWRTEISALFGLIEFSEDGGIAKPSAICKQLAQSQDLVQFFKYYLFKFQYPGAHMKSDKVIELIKRGVKFQPAKYILELLRSGQSGEKRFYITKAELTHCVFNDLSALSKEKPLKEIIKTINKHRNGNVEYDHRGDVIRYAGDILDYMVMANLLEIRGVRYLINEKEKFSIQAFLDNKDSFQGYDSLYSRETISSREVNAVAPSWFAYVNRKLSADLFKTDLVEYIGIEEKSIKELINLFKVSQDNDENLEFENTKGIGDMGESLVFGHECMRLKLGGRVDLKRLVKRIPTHLAVGYDIQSMELDGVKKRYIEVKTTISANKLNFYNVHLTPNEWSTAETTSDAYFIYRLFLSKSSQDLILIRNPVGLYRDQKISMTPRNGADIKFSDNISQKEELLVWTE